MSGEEAWVATARDLGSHGGGLGSAQAHGEHSRGLGRRERCQRCVWATRSGCGRVGKGWGVTQWGRGSRDRIRGG